MLCGLKAPQSGNGRLDRLTPKSYEMKPNRSSKIAITTVDSEHFMYIHKIMHWSPCGMCIPASELEPLAK